MLVYQRVYKYTKQKWQKLEMSPAKPGRMAMENSKINRNLWKSWDQAGASKLRFLFLSYPEGFFAEFAIEAMAENPWFTKDGDVPVRKL